MRRWSDGEQDDEAVSPEVRARAVRLVFEHVKDHPSRWGGTSRDNRVDDRGKLGRGVDAVGSARLLQHCDYRLPSLHLASL